MGCETAAKVPQKSCQNRDYAATGGQSTIEQIAYQVPQDQKMAALCTLLYTTQGESTLIFGRTKFGVEKLGKQLSKLGFTVGTLHGNKSQRAREDVLTAFREGRCRRCWLPMWLHVDWIFKGSIRSSTTNCQNRAIFLRTVLVVRVVWDDRARQLRC